MKTIKRNCICVMIGAAMMSSACRPRSEPEPVVDGVWPAERVVLYEGLPHPAWESELLEEQLRTKETQELHGHPFYKETLPLKLDDSKRLTDILGSAGTYKRFSGEKKCGGFHPDFVVEWHVGEDRFRVLICFGCREVKLYGPQIESRYDLDQVASNELKKILHGYRKNRPAAERKP